MKSVKDQILAFILTTPGTHHGGDIQKMQFKTKNNGYSTGSTIKRRLLELVEEGKIHVEYERGSAVFSGKVIEKRKPHFEIRNGVAVMI